MPTLQSLIPDAHSECCVDDTVINKFSKSYRIDCSKSVTVGQLYRHFGLHLYHKSKQAQINLALAVDKRGNPKGTALLQVPLYITKYIESFHQSELKGEIVRVREKKSLSALKTWTRKLTINSSVSVSRKTPVCCLAEKQMIVPDDVLARHFDTGAYLTRSKIGVTLDEVLAEAHMYGIREIIVPCHYIYEGRQAARVADMYRGKINIYFSAGLGANAVLKLSKQWKDNLEKLIKLDTCICVGVIGLDMRLSHAYKMYEMEIFKQLVKLACKYRKPILMEVHDATKQALKILRHRQHELPPMALYDFTGDQDDICHFVDLGCYFVATLRQVESSYYLKDYMYTALKSRQIPACKILLSSGAGGTSAYNESNPAKHNDIFVKHWERWTVISGFFLVKYLVKKILQQIECEQSDEVFYHNARRFFQLEPSSTSRNISKSTRRPGIFVRKRMNSVFKFICQFFNNFFMYNVNIAHIWFIIAIIAWAITDILFL